MTEGGKKGGVQPAGPQTGRHEDERTVVGAVPPVFHHVLIVNGVSIY